MAKKAFRNIIEVLEYYFPNSNAVEEYIIKEGKSYEAGQYAAERPIHCFRKKLDIYEKPKSL